MASRPMTVVQLLPELHSGGVERGTLEIGAYLARHGHESIVVSEGGPLVALLEKQGSRHITLPVGGKTPRTLASLLPLRRLMRNQPVDIVHLRSRVPAWAGFLAVKSLPVRRRPKLVTTFHGFYSINAYSAIMTRGEMVIAVSHTIAEHMRTHYRVPSHRIQVIHRGIDENIFAPERVDPSKIAALKHHWRLHDMQPPVIMLPGRISRIKGHDIFIRSLARIKALPWTALCVGLADAKAVFMKKLTRLIQDNGLEDRVRFVGDCADMPTALCLSDIVVSATSAKPEAFGRTTIEAQAMGKPVVATAHGGSLETILPGRTGWLVAPGDAVGMASALAEAVGYPKIRDQYGRAAQAWVRAHFTTQKMCQKTLNLYEKLIM